MGKSMNNVMHVKLGEGRRVAIPAEICQRYGLGPGDLLVLEASDHAMTLRPLDDVVREVQDFFAAAAPAGEVLSDELLKDRRTEAKRELGGD
jgi:bifunctional DNA-binding transcriptional regulator/antitoxin component of YhaV-PrlF toxin-antitoxin module